MKHDRQAAAHAFLSKASQSGSSFSMEDLARASGWAIESANTNRSKHLRGIIEEDGVFFRVAPDRLPSLGEFRVLLSQVKVPKRKYEANGYSIGPEIGQGGFGKVFRGVRLLDETPVALKFPAQIGGAGRENLRRFFREQRLQGPIEHPHVARVYEWDSQELWISMELATTTLRSQISEPTVLLLFLQALRGLAWVHSRGIIHRDFVPENILVFETNGEKVAKVADFGLAVEFRRNTTVITQISPGPQTFGHHGYVSPEQRYDPGSVDLRTDIYAAGIVLGEILTNSSGFSAADLDSIQEVALRNIVELCLKKKPELRFQTVDELIVALEAVIAPEAESIAENQAPALQKLQPEPSVFLAIRESVQNRRKLFEEYFISALQDALRFAVPDGNEPEPFMSSAEQAIGSVRAALGLIDRIAELDDRESLEGCFKALMFLLNAIWVDQDYRHKGDLPKLLAYLTYCYIAAALIREHRFATLADFLEENYTIRLRNGQPHTFSYGEFSRSIASLDNLGGQQRYYSPVGAYFFQLCSEKKINISPEAYIEADTLLWLRSSIRKEQLWFPRACHSLHHYPPDLLLQARSKRTASKVAPLLGLQTLDGAGEAVLEAFAELYSQLGEGSKGESVGLYIYANKPGEFATR